MKHSFFDAVATAIFAVMWLPWLEIEVFDPIKFAFIDVFDGREEKLLMSREK